MTKMELGIGDAPISRVKTLKSLTHEAHDALDKRIMGAQPFSSRERYGLFLKVQYLFHRDIDALFYDSTLDALLPDLSGRRRLALIEQDLADLGMELPPTAKQPEFVTGNTSDLPTALGWLYVAEGSNLGAAFLLKEAIKLGLSEEFGARHLAGAPEGRGLHWRTFTAALDEVELSPEDERRAADGAEAAFVRVRSYVEDTFA